MLLARRAQVHVRIDERRQQRAARAVDDLAHTGCVDGPRLGELGDAPVADEHVALGVERLARIEHARSADEQVGRRRLPADEGIGQQLAHAGCGAAACSRAGASTS